MGSVARSRERSVAWSIAAALLVHLALVGIAGHGDTALTTDSMGYIDVARNIAAGRGIVTHVVPIGFREQGLVPFTRQPPGYPLLIAPLLLLGIPAGAAVRLLSVGGSVAALILFGLLARRFDPARATLLVLLYAVSYPFAEVGSLAITEPLFLAAHFAALLVGSGDPAHPFPGAPRRAFATGLLCGSLVGLRYAGGAALALFAALAIARALRGTAGSRMPGWRVFRAWGSGAIIGALPTIVALLSARSFGEAARDREGFLRMFLSCAAHSAADLLTPVPRLEPKPWPYMPLGVALLVFAAFRAWRRSSPGISPAVPEGSSRAAWAFVALYPGLYLAWIAWIRTFIYLNSSPTRLLLPAYPFLLILLVTGPRAPSSIERSARRAHLARALLIGIFFSYALGNIGKAIEDSRNPQPALDLGSIPEWIDQHAAPGEAIIATEPESFAYAMPDRRIVALVRSPYSTRDLESSDVERLSTEQDARWLILLRARAQQAFAGSYGDYVRSLVKESGVRELRLAAALPAGLVFEIAR